MNFDKMEISKNFDGGSLGAYEYDSQGQILSIDLAANQKGGVNHSFCFYCENSPSSVHLKIKNASSSLFAHGWQGYTPFIKTDSDWSRVESSFEFDGKSASLSLDKLPPNFMLSWYPPYPSVRLMELLGSVAENKNFVLSQKGGVDFVEAGNPNAPHLFVLGRQHPGETMASFFVEGLLNRLADNSPHSKALLEKYRFTIVPLANPRGAKGGFHRTDSEGNDYNLCWNRKDIAEVNAIKEYLGGQKPPMAVLDVHGDEVSKNDYFFYTPKYLSAANRPVFDAMRANGAVAPLKMPGALKHFLKELIVRRRIVKPVEEAAGYLERSYKSLALVVELGSHRKEPANHIALGRAFVDGL